MHKGMNHIYPLIIVHIHQGVFSKRQNLKKSALILFSSEATVLSIVYVRPSVSYSLNVREM